MILVMRLEIEIADKKRLRCIYTKSLLCQMF